MYIGGMEEEEEEWTDEMSPARETVCVYARERSRDSEVVRKTNSDHSTCPT
jgi:hypothetical protein